MKRFDQLTGLLSVIVLCTLSACEQNIRVESVVHEDGSIDRTIVFSGDGPSKNDPNFFGIGREKGWEVSMQEENEPDSSLSFGMPKRDTTTNQQADTNKTSKKKNLTFRKTFNSVEDANLEMNTSNDTLFRIKSSFEKKFKWFYTYMKYSDTYISINRFPYAPVNEYLTVEDYAFIDRLPAEGAAVAKADSLYAEKLNNKIFEDLLPRALYDEHYDFVLKALADHEYDQKSLDTLRLIREKTFVQLMDDQHGNKESGIFKEDDFMIQLMRHYNLPVPPVKAVEKYHGMIAELEKRMTFAGLAAESQFTHAISMPWEVVSTNADSVNGTTLYWRPRIIKYTVKDYTMYAEARKLNYWAVILSGMLVLLTAFVLIKRKQKRVSV